ncbi:MAG: DUF6754 domain-containing protein [Phycisphaerales bacterium]
MKRWLIVSIAANLIALAGPGTRAATAQGAAPAPPTNLTVADHPWDNGDSLDLKWELSPDDASLLNYQVFKALGQIGPVNQSPLEFELVGRVPPGTGEYQVSHVPAEIEKSVKDMESHRNLFSDPPLPEDPRKKVKLKVSYLFRVVAVAKDGAPSTSATTTEPFTPTREWFMGNRFSLSIITVIFCGAVIFWINRARKGKPIKVRKIAGLEAVDEAVGRATEMGRSILYVPGTQDINEIQTIASLAILSRVSKTAAEYDAKVEIPVARSLVMATARETVHAAYLAAGRPDAYNEDLIYYVTDEQFGYVAYLQGMMVREKPATCFYMGAFYAESLILAETGNSIGAIQIAGTAMPAQLPFFVAACDYTLIGEEFFAASAYLSGSAEELGSLKGQDVGKVMVAVLLLLGVLMATIATMADNATLQDWVTYLKEIILT